MVQSGNMWWNENRTLVFKLVTVLVFVVLLVKLFSMQVLSRPAFIDLAETNRIRAEVIEPLRGKIFDRNGNLMVENRPSYSLYAQPWIVKRNRSVVAELAKTLEIEPASVDKRISIRGWNTFYPAPVKRDISMSALARLEAIHLDLPGIIFRHESKRSYIYPEAVHLLGYVGERGATAAKSKRERFSLIGKSGVEKSYEDVLGGVPGVRYLQIDANGRILGAADEQLPQPSRSGRDIYLNIDGDLQRYAFELLGERSGSVVALDPRDGAVLTLLSLPDYDPSIFAGVLPPEVWNKLGSDERHPLINRAIQGLYPPGSTYKMVLLAACLNEGVANENTKVTCKGGMQLGNRWFKCWNKGGHGTLGPEEALQRSCDVFFYTMGLSLGVTKMAQYAQYFGLGGRTGIDIDGELGGIIPTEKYFDKKYGVRKWTRGQLANIAIGQGDVLTTPLQLAVYTAALATGKLVKPHVVDRMVDPNTGDTEVIEPSITPIELPESIRAKVCEAMWKVVNEDGGTARWLRDKDYEIAGKTGTSQNPHGEDHGLFVAFAPYDDPQIVAIAMVEHGEHGSTSAAPIVIKLIKRYLDSRSNMNQVDIAVLNDNVVQQVE